MSYDAIPSDRGVLVAGWIRVLILFSQVGASRSSDEAIISGGYGHNERFR
jgi:hypothetical protein